MALALPNSLFASHRLRQSGEGEFRLTEAFRASLLHGSETPLPAALPTISHSPLHELPLLTHHLDGVLHHFLRLGHAPEMIDKLAKRLVDGVRRNPDGYVAASTLVPHGPLYTARHALQCAILLVLIADALKFDTVLTHELTCAALTMNVGAVSLHDELNHQEGPPSTSQRQWLDIHPLISAAILREAGVPLGEWHQAVLLHHEKRDGSGYPFHLRGDAIPLQIHLLHILDTVSAKLMPRGYRNRIPAKKALATLYATPEEPVDGQVSGTLIKLLGFYPPGSFVELENGEKALVVHGGQQANAPKVIALHSPDRLIDTADESMKVVRAITVSVDANRLSRYESFWAEST